jgi:FhuF 2Fe-2S C-terminal domain
MPEELVSRQSSVAGGSVDVADALASIAEELGTDRLDVCGQRLCELRAWELAAEAGPEILAGESESDLVSRVVAELGPLVERVNELSRRPRSALWRGAGDRVAQALVLAGEERGDAERGRRAARRALSVPGPLAGRLRIERLVVDGEVELLQVRNGCCLWHRVPGEPKCSSCPLLDPGERVARLVAEREESG